MPLPLAVCQALEVPHQPHRFPGFLPRWGLGRLPGAQGGMRAFFPFPANRGRCGVSSSGRGCGEGTDAEPLGDPEKLRCGRGAVERKGLLKGGMEERGPQVGVL